MPDDCNPVARVYVDGERIPIINDGLGLQMRKEGPADIVRMADVRFPVQWTDESYSHVVNEGLHDRARIEVRDTVTDEYETVLDG